MGRVFVDPVAVQVPLEQDYDSILLRRLRGKGQGARLGDEGIPAHLEARSVLFDEDEVTPGQEGKTYVTVMARADSTQKDSALILVKKDTPRLQVGGDTLIARGTTLTYAPEAPQEYGSVVLFKWDLNGDGIYEDSAQSAPASPSTYAEAKEYPSASTSRTPRATTPRSPARSRR